jgi:hypothetical protein
MINGIEQTFTVSDNCGWMCVVNDFTSSNENLEFVESQWRCCNGIVELLIRPFRALSSDFNIPTVEEINGLVSALRRAIAEVKQCWPVIGWVTKIYFKSSSVLRNAR